MQNKLWSIVLISIGLWYKMDFTGIYNIQHKLLQIPHCIWFTCLVPKTAYWGSFWLWLKLKTHKFSNRTTCYFHQTQSRKCWQDFKNHLGWFSTGFQRKWNKQYTDAQTFGFSPSQNPHTNFGNIVHNSVSTQYIWKQ